MIPDTAAVRSLGVCNDAVLALQMKKICAAAGVEFESLPETESVLAALDRLQYDFIIIDPVCLEFYTQSPVQLSEFIDNVRNRQPGLPILVLLQHASGEDIQRKAIDAGVTDFISLPLSIPEFTVRVRSFAENAVTRRESAKTSRVHEEEIRSTIGEILLREYETLYVLGKAAEYKDRETGYHIARVSHYSRLIARVIGESTASQDVLFHASALHDVGKLGIPDFILLKPGKLTNDEFEIMKTHSMLGHGILKNSRSSYLLTGAMIALTHHEKYDGTGYPMQLAKEEIPLYGRIVGIADVFDALTTKRPYKDAWPIFKAFELLARERGHQFDPILIDAFLSNSLGVEDIYYNHADTETAEIGP